MDAHCWTKRDFMNDYLMNITCTGKLEEARAAYFGQPLDPAMLVDYGNVLLTDAGGADSYLRNQNTKKDPFAISYVTRYGVKDMDTWE